MTRRCCHSIALLAAALALGASGQALAAGSWQEELERDARDTRYGPRLREQNQPWRRAAQGSA